MIFRLTCNAIMAGCVVLAILIAAPFAKGQTHHDRHPDWLRNSGCCGEDDTRKVRVRFLPGHGWAIVWIDNPPGLPVIRLVKPVRFDIERIRKSQDGNWWAGLRVVDGVAVGIWIIGSRQCVFGHGSGQ